MSKPNKMPMRRLILSEEDADRILAEVTEVNERRAAMGIHTDDVEKRFQRAALDFLWDQYNLALAPYVSAAQSEAGGPQGSPSPLVQQIATNALAMGRLRTETGLMPPTEASLGGDRFAE